MAKKEESLKEKKGTTKKSMPVGFIIIIILLVIGILSALLNLFDPLIQIFTFIDTGLFAFIYLTLVIVIDSVILFGIVKRKNWVRTLALIWFSVVLLINISNDLGFLIKPNLADKFYDFNTQGALTRENFIITVIIASLPGIITGILLLWYFYKKKDYFVN